MLTRDEHPLIALLSTCKPSSQFAAVMGYANGKGDVASYSLLFNISYSRAVEKSLRLLPTLKFRDTLLRDDVCCSDDDFFQARKELELSFRLSLEGKNHSTSEHAYHQIYGANGEILKGCKLHTETRFIHLYGFVVYRVILKSGELKIKNSSGKTLAKNWMRSNLPVGKFVQFRLEPGKYEKLSLGKISLLSQEVPGLSLSEENSLLYQALQMRE